MIVSLWSVRNLAAPVASLHRWVLHPVHMLTHALEQLRGGDLKVRIPDDAMLDEFRKMTTAFNDMVEEIDDLKIANYEKQLARQKLEALYLKQQITPHFMINCLNTIYQLTENNHADLARQMLQNLSVHLRYTLSSGPDRLAFRRAKPCKKLRGAFLHPLSRRAAPAPFLRRIAAKCNGCAAYTPELCGKHDQI